MWGIQDSSTSFHGKTLGSGEVGRKTISELSGTWRCRGLEVSEGVVRGWWCRPNGGPSVTLSKHCWGEGSRRLGDV